MSDQAVIASPFTFFILSRDSFLAALDDASIRLCSVMQFSGQPQASGFTEMISWVEARRSRSIMIQVKAGSILIEAN